MCTHSRDMDLSVSIFKCLVLFHLPEMNKHSANILLVLRGSNSRKRGIEGIVFDLDP